MTIWKTQTTKTLISQCPGPRTWDQECSPSCFETIGSTTGVPGWYTAHLILVRDARCCNNLEPRRLARKKPNTVKARSSTLRDNGNLELPKSWASLESKGGAGFHILQMCSRLPVILSSTS